MPHGPFTTRVNGQVVDASHINVLGNALENTYTVAEVNDLVGAQLTSGEADALYAAKAATETALSRIDSGIISVASYGVVGDGVTDDTADIQAAFDAADAMKDTALEDGWVGVPSVVFPPGEYLISSPLIWKRHNIIGTHPHDGCRFVWAGSAGSTVMTSSDGISMKRWSGFACYAEDSDATTQTGWPGTWFDAGSNNVDWGGQLCDLHFTSCTDDAIKVDGWFNLHWRDLRFDQIGGYAIRLAPSASLSLSSFLIDGFTYDHQADMASGAVQGQGFLRVDFAASAVHIGTIRLANGRIEVNGDWDSPQAVIHVTHPDPSANEKAAFHLDNVTYHDGASMAGDVVIYRDTADADGWESLMATNFYQVGASAIRGGSWSAHIPQPPLLDGWSYLAIGTINGGGTAVHTIKAYADNEPWGRILQGYKGADAEPVFAVDRDGDLLWGSGSAASDTTLYRLFAGHLMTDTNLVVGTGGGWNTGHLLLGSYRLWVDSTGDLRIKNGAPSSDLDGVVVGSQS